jgi:hypothetical protein
MTNERSSLHNVQVRHQDPAPIIELLEGDPMMSMFSYFVSAPADGWVSVLPQRIDKGLKVAKSLSQKLHTDTFCLRTYSEDAFLYAYFRNGEKHDEFCSSPQVLQQLQEMDDEMAAIVLQWEQGEISAEEYRERVNEYLSAFDGRVERTRAQIESVIRGKSAGDAVPIIIETVRAEFRGKEADKLIRDIVSKRFPGTDVSLKPGGEASGGKPLAFQHLASPDNVERVLRSKASAADMLRRFALELKMKRADTSFQHVEAVPHGWTRVG